MTEQTYRKDEYKKVRIPFGFNKQLDKALLPLFHTFFVAITGHGKTLGMKSLLLIFNKLYPDWKILIIDSKDKRDYADLNSDIPICFVETTEPLDLKNLLEPVVGAKMMYYFDKIIEEAIFDTLAEIQGNIERKITQADNGKLKIHGRELGKLRVLNHLLKKLVNLVERPEITDKLELRDGFNVMPVSLPKVPTNLKRAFQQLIVRSVLRKLMLVEYEKVLLVLDEVHKWSPQRYSSIVKQPLSELISEGRSKDVFVWMADQALTKVDKEPLKNVKIWVVGQQLQEHEVEDAITAVSDIADLKVDKRDIKRLRIGNWIIVDGMHRTVEHVYLQPYNVPDSVATEIVKGANPETAESFIFKFESKLRESLGDEDLVYKEKYEEEHRIRKEFEKRLGEYSKDIKKLQEEKEKIQEALRIQMELSAEIRDKAEAFEALQKALAPLLPSTSSSIPADIRAPAVTMTEIDERINQRLAESEHIRVVSVDVNERVKELIKNDVASRMIAKIQSLPEAAKKASLWLHEKKQVRIGELYSLMYEKTARRIPGAFYINVLKPLQNAGLIVKENGNIRWTLEEKLTMELKDIIANGDLDEITKYLTSLLF